MHESGSRRIYIILLCGLSVLLTDTSGNQASAQVSHRQAESLISDLYQEVVGTLSQPDLTPDRLRASGVSMTERYFDVPWMARFIAARYWRRATESQRTELQRLYLQVIVDNYISVFTGYLGSSQNFAARAREVAQTTRIEIGSSQTLRGGRLAINVTLYRPGSLPVQLVMHRNSNGQPRIIDVTAAGISLLTTKRSEFSAALRQHGGNIDRLIASLRQVVSR